jgi:SpoVK/Ycf46/Vps4 family AAA+-type ATPase
MGKGAHALFTGQPGTGKTMAADILAGELDLDLYKIDLSTVMSKFIGETEKNLARIFGEAATSNAILFFDEADALFGKRTEVKDAHDRYANLEVSYLLQKMDEYEGLVILATNLRQNLDKAFLRRLHFVIDFPFPGPADRLRICQGIWPDGAPRAPELDLPALAQELEVAGGSIRNIALSAAYLAAAGGQPIQMAHLRRAAESEYRKIGKFSGQSEGSGGALCTNTNWTPNRQKRARRSSARQRTARQKRTPAPRAFLKPSGAWGCCRAALATTMFNGW